MTIDVSAFSCDTSPCRQQLAGTDDPGRLTAGVLKLAQKWLIEFFTERGSMRFLPQRGSSFFTAVRLGRARTPLDIEQLFEVAAEEIRLQFAEDYDETTPDDERLVSARLVSADISIRGVRLSVEFVSAAGARRVITVPVIKPIQVS